MKNRKRTTQETSKTQARRSDTLELPHTSKYFQDESRESHPIPSKLLKLSSQHVTNAGKAPTTGKQTLKAKCPVNNTTVKSATKSAGEDRFGREFYNKPCEELAKALLGQTLVRIKDTGDCLKARIVETEAYLGAEDKAAHSFGGKKTKRNAAMFMDPGTAYVYHIYGMYTCMNISSRGDGAAVLLRACEPLEGKAVMKKERSLKKSETSKPLNDKQISSGPSKLTQAMSIDKQSVDQQDLTSASHIWVEPGMSIATNQIVSSARIGVNYAGDWAQKKLRFYVLGNEHVSSRDKTAEAELK